MLVGVGICISRYMLSGSYINCGEEKCYYKGYYQGLLDFRLGDHAKFLWGNTSWNNFSKDQEKWYSVIF